MINMKKQTFFMQTLKTAVAFLMAGTISAGFIACSDDDDDNNNNSKDAAESESVDAFDDLSYFQGAFVETDSLGNFVNRSVGAVLANLDNDTTHLFVGVNNVEEALGYFENALAPDIERTTSVARSYTYTLTDKEGKAQGTVTFVPSEESGHVAELTTNLTGLKHFKKVTFLLNSAWPFNSEKGKYRLGDVRHMNVHVDGKLLNGSFNGQTGFVCVREKSNGVKPLYVALTKDDHRPAYHKSKTLLQSKYCPNESTAKLISEQLRKDWDFYVACFEEAGEGQLNKDQNSWINKREVIWYVPGVIYWYAIKLHTGDLSKWETSYHDPYKHVLMKIDWEDD